MFRTHQTAIRMPCTRVLYLVKSNIANSKFHKIFEVKMHLKYVLDWAFLIKPAEWFAIFSNIRGSGSRRLSNIVRGERCSFKIAFPENSCFCCQHFRNTNFKEHLLVAASKYSFESIFTMNDLRAILWWVSLFVLASCSFNIHNRGYY